MKNEIVVKVAYKDASLKIISERQYSLKEYTDMLKADLLRLITDVEDLVYAVNENKPKSEWSDSSWAMFAKVKHKMLDKAGEIGRLPENILSEKE